MNGVGRIRWDDVEVERFRTSDRMESEMLSIARKLAKQAQSNGGRYTKKYRAKGLGGGRAAAFTKHQVAHWDEWGTVHHQPVAPMRRALSQLGLWKHTTLEPKP